MHLAEMSCFITMPSIIHKKGCILTWTHPLIFLSSDPAGTQTQDLQNRNLTLYSLSYGALMRVQKYKKSLHSPNNSPFFPSKPHTASQQQLSDLLYAHDRQARTAKVTTEEKTLSQIRKRLT